jgi:hypothetical protein
VLEHIVERYKPKKVLDVGTGMGLTARLLRSCGADVTTIGALREQRREFSLSFDDANELSYLLDKETFVSIREGLHSEGIRCIVGDTATTEFEEIGSVDLAFIDGAHGYSYVKNDSEKAFCLLTPGGVIVWHDYEKHWGGVWSYINGIRSHELLHFRNTSLVMAMRQNGEILA